MSRPPTSAEGLPGSALLHPLTLACLGLWVLNDHVLKALVPSMLTGKLSDLTGLVVTPLLLLAVAEWLGLRRPRRVLHIAVASTGLAFAAIQVSPLAGDVWRWGLAILRWPFRAGLALTANSELPQLLPVVHTADPTDLMCLPALGAALWIARCRGPQG